jgi:uridine kinase
MLEILRALRARYPLMEPQDAVKFLYQRAFGTSHMIESRESALIRLREEMRGIEKDPSIPLFEPLGAGLTRMNLASPEFPELSTAAGMFYASVRMPMNECFERELDELVRLWPECAPFVSAYRANGCPPPGHSEAYRAAYRPAYRVVLSKFQRLITVFRRIDALADRPSILIAIDGRCAAGKSSLSQLIASVYGAMVLHMDDFFQTEAQKAAERSAVANIDVKRLTTALRPFAAGEPFAFRPYNCLTGEFLSPRQVNPSRVRVVEGSYCLHPAIRLDYDLAIFMTVDPDTQKARLRVRNPELYDRFVAEWVPQEEAYFSAHNVSDGCLIADGRALDERDEDEGACP